MLTPCPSPRVPRPSPLAPRFTLQPSTLTLTLALALTPQPSPFTLPHTHTLTQVLLKYKGLFHFLTEHAPEVAAEIRDMYTTTMSAIYLKHVKGYLSELMRLRIDPATKSDLLGTEEVRAGRVGGRAIAPAHRRATSPPHRLPNSPTTLSQHPRHSPHLPLFDGFLTARRSGRSPPPSLLTYLPTYLT